MHKYLLVCEINPVMQGVEYTSLPLHCTLVHWFWSTVTPGNIFTALSTTLYSTKKFTIESSQSALFGPKRNIPVHILLPCTALQHLHAQALFHLTGLVESFTEPEYVGSGYRPHVTTKDEAFVPGRSHTVARIYLVEKRHSLNRIRWIQQLYS